MRFRRASLSVIYKENRGQSAAVKRHELGRYKPKAITQVGKRGTNPLRPQENFVETAAAVVGSFAFG